MISTQYLFGMLAPSTSVVRPSHDGPVILMASVPQMPSNRAIAANESPTVTSTCSMWRSYSGRIRMSSVTVAKTAPTTAPTRIDTRKPGQVSAPMACATAQPTKALRVRNAPWAKFSTCMRP